MGSLRANNIDSIIEHLLNNPIIYVYGILLLLFSLSLYKSTRITVEILQNLHKQRNKNKKHPDPTIRGKYRVILYAYLSIYLKCL